MSNYNSDSIDSLGILGGVREKPASIGLESHNHTFVEILANSIDEYREGYGDKIIVTRHIDNSISIQDFGRSVPMDKNTKGEYAYNKVFNELWSGGKYNNNKKNKDGKKNYKYSLGTNGCGATGTNYCSDFLECTAIAPNNNKYYVRYEKGIMVTELDKSKHKEEYTGTLIHWLPSQECFRGLSIIDDDFIKSILQQQSIVNANLRFIYNNEIINDSTEYYYENGIKDYIKEISNNKNISDIISFSVETSGIEGEMKEEFDMLANVHFTFNNDVALMKYFHNSSYLENGGTPEDFIKTSFVYTIDKYIKDNNMYNKSESKVKFSDIQDSLIIISDTYSTISLYTDQVKKKIKSDFMNKYMTDYIKEKLNIYFIENKLETTNIINQILINKRANDTAEKTKLKIKKKLSETVDNINNRVDGLVDCEIHGEDAELYITEGQSALGGCVLSRNPYNQAGMPIRGKILNCLKAPYSKIFASEIITNLIKVIGCGIESDKKNKELGQFDMSKLRFGKIIFLVDEDADAKSISCLLLTMFYRLMPQLLSSGRIYIAQTPLFEIRNLDTDEVFYANSEKEKDNIVKNIKRSYVGRNKGIGELEFETLSKTAMNPETRNLLQVKINNEQEMINMFEKWMNDDVTDRKKHIENNLDKYINSVE